jgi:hypothetical protein
MADNYSFLGCFKDEDAKKFLDKARVIEFHRRQVLQAIELMGGEKAAVTLDKEAKAKAAAEPNQSKPREK